MIINPFYLLISIYFIANTISFFMLINSGGFEVFGVFREISSSAALGSYVLQLAGFVFLFIIYKLSFVGPLRKKFLGDNWAYFLILITLFFFIFNQLTGAGRAGTGFSFEGNSLLNIFFVLLKPDLWFFLLAPFLISNRLFWFSAIFYLVSLISRGWMGSVFLLLLIFLIREYPVKLKLNNIIVFILGSVFLVLSLPLLDALKWGMRLGISFEDIVFDLAKRDYWSTLLIVLESVIQRFQNLNYVAYVFENKSYFLDSLTSGSVEWFYQDGIFNDIYCKFYSCPTSLNIYVAEDLYGETGLAWNVDPGLSGWFAILGLYSVFLFAFIGCILFYSGLLYRNLYGSSGALLIGVFSLIYLYHGWLGAFYNTIIYASFLYIFLKFRVFHKAV